MQEKQLKFYVPPKIHRDAKSFAALNGVSLREVLLAGLEYQMKAGRLLPNARRRLRRTTCAEIAAG